MSRRDKHVTHELRQNYWFIFYSEWLDTMWIMTFAEFIAAAAQNKSGINVGKHSIWFNGMRRNKDTGHREPYVKKQFEQYVARDFSKLIQIASPRSVPASDVDDPTLASASNPPLSDKFLAHPGDFKVIRRNAPPLEPWPEPVVDDTGIDEDDPT